MKITQSKYIRYLFGGILLFLIFFCFWYSKLFLFIFSCFFIYLALYEYNVLFKKNDVQIHNRFAGLISCIFAYIFIYVDSDFYKMIVYLILISFIIPFILTILKNQKPYIKSSLCTSCFIFFVFCGLFIIKLQNINVLLTYFSCILLGDYLASIIGQKVKKKIYIAKEISPNKTLIGVVSHIAGSCFIVVIAFSYIDLSIIQSLVWGLVISISAQFGDLAFSCIKREIKVKHSSSLFCDYGGIFDRIDAFIFSAPAAYFLIHFF